VICRLAYADAARHRLFFSFNWWNFWQKN